MTFKKSANVFVILENISKGEALRFASISPVWILKSSSLRETMAEGADGITAIEMFQEEDLKKLFFRVFFLLDNHQGVLRQSQPFQTLSVVGLSGSGEISDFLEENGFRLLRNNRNGFLAKRK